MFAECHWLLIASRLGGKLLTDILSFSNVDGRSLNRDVDSTRILSCCIRALGFHRVSKNLNPAASYG